MSGVTDAIIAAIIGELVTTHHCHTVILYGSRATDDFSEASDFDVLGVRARGEKTKDGRRFQGELLDAVIHPESDLGLDSREPLADEFIRLRNGKVLKQQGDYGDRLVARAAARFQAGPKPLDAAEREHIRTWTAKMIARVARGDDVESAYRRVWLLTQILEDYFKLRDKWFLGPKESFAWLRVNDQPTFALYEDALKPDASRGALRRLADRVLTGS